MLGFIIKKRSWLNQKIVYLYIISFIYYCSDSQNDKSLLEHALYPPFKCFNVLLSYGSNPNTITSEGSILTLCAEKGFYPALLLLIKRGANILLTNSDEMNVLTIIINQLNLFYYDHLEYLNILINVYIYIYLYIYYRCGCTIQREFIEESLCKYILLCTKYYNLINNNKDECIYIIILY